MSDGEDEIETTHAIAEESTSVGTVDRATMLKAQRKTLRGRITRTIKRVQEIHQRSRSDQETLGERNSRTPERF